MSAPPRPAASHPRDAGYDGRPRGRIGRANRLHRSGTQAHDCSGTIRLMPTRTITAESRLLNRELSWVEFNARVLDLACDEEQPLLERVKFCSIFSSNLDEFFMVRVAGLMGQEAAGFAVRSADGMTPVQALADIKARVTELTGRQARLWKRELRPELAAEGIEIATIEECTPKELQRLEAIFTRDIYPVLTPLAVGTGHQFPYISGLSLSLGVLATDPDTAEERFARVKVPEGLDRFVDSGKRLVPLESVIAHYLPSLFPGMEIAERVVVPGHARRRLRRVRRRRRPPRGGRVRAQTPSLR